MLVWRQRQVSDENQTLLNHPQKSAIPDVLWRFLTSRLSSQADLNKILNPTLADLKDPFLLKDMDKAVERLIQAYKAEEKICIYADFDLDGASGLAVLYDAFTHLGFENVIFYQPKRLSEGYGFHPHAVEDLQKQSVGLIITVDVGITSLAAFEKAQELGVDVILTDHHLPGEQLPKAFCIVNPNQPLCTSGLGYLCGAGVAFYLVRALYRKLVEFEMITKERFDLKSVLDFFCIGTLTDMVPLVDDNRVLVKHGLNALEKTQRPGLKVLLEELDLGGKDLSSQDVSIKFAPKLNALSRMESDTLPIHIYLENDHDRAKSIVKKILKNNETRQTLQQEAVILAEELLKSWPYKDFVYVSSDQFHRGVIGLIATKIANERHCPVFIGSKNTEGVIVGSSRLPPGSEEHLVDALTAADSVLTRYGGHAAAAGFELHESSETEFIKKLDTYFQDIKTEKRPVVIEYDTSAQVRDLSEGLFKWYNFLGPYGVGFPIPLFRFQKLELMQLKTIKGGHIKMVFKDQHQKVDVLYFSPAEKKVSILTVGHLYDVVGEIQMNYFNHSKTVQILLKDVKPYEV